MHLYLLCNKPISLKLRLDSFQLIAIGLDHQIPHVWIIYFQPIEGRKFYRPNLSWKPALKDQRLSFAYAEISWKLHTSLHGLVMKEVELDF
jgi:hypothetical protein